MKLLLTILLLAGFSAQAESLHPDTFAKYSKLVVFDVAAEVSNNERVNSGEVKVNTTTKSISIQLENHPCPNVPVCMAPIKLVAQVDFKLDATYTSSCDSTVYVGKSEDGDMVSVEDLQASSCVKKSQNDTLVTMITSLDDGRLVASQFEGSALGKRGSTKPSPKVIEGSLVNIHVDKEDALLRNVTSGYVDIDLSKSEIKLTLVRRNDCPPGRMCAALMPAPHIVVVPLTMVRQGGCNVTIYEGSLDQRPVDGNLEKVVVVDNSTSLCPNVIPEDQMIEVQYDTVTAGMDGSVGVYRSTFTGRRTK